MDNTTRKTVIVSRYSKTKSIVTAIIATVLYCAIFVFLLNYSTKKSYVEMIKQGHPFAYQDTSYEEKFSNYFTSPNLDWYGKRLVGSGILYA